MNKNNINTSTESSCPILDRGGAMSSLFLADMIWRLQLSSERKSHKRNIQACKKVEVPSRGYEIDTNIATRIK